MTPNTPENQASQASSAPAPAETPSTETPDSGIKSKLSDAQKEMLARKSRGGAGTGWQSTGKGHKPTQASGKQAKTEKKVRW